MTKGKSSRAGGRAPSGSRAVKQQIKTRVEKFGVKAVAKTLGVSSKTLTEKLKSRVPARELIPNQKRLEKLTEKVKDATYKKLRTTATEIKKEEKQSAARKEAEREEKQFAKQARAMAAKAKEEAREKAREEKRQAKLAPRPIGKNKTAYYPGGLKQLIKKEGGYSEPKYMKSLETLAEATRWANKVTGGIAYFVIVREVDSKGEESFAIYYIPERINIDLTGKESESEE